MSCVVVRLCTCILYVIHFMLHVMLQAIRICHTPDSSTLVCHLLIHASDKCLYTHLPNLINVTARSHTSMPYIYSIRLCYTSILYIYTIRIRCIPLYARQEAISPEHCGQLTQTHALCTAQPPSRSRGYIVSGGCGRCGGRAVGEGHGVSQCTDMSGSLQTVLHPHARGTQ